MKIHENGVHEWHHKDGSRMYWGIKAWKTGVTMRAWEGAPEQEKDAEWTYEIYHGQSIPDVRVAFNCLWIQIDVTPDPETFFNDWVSSLLPVATGFAKYTEEWYGVGTRV